MSERTLLGHPLYQLTIGRRQGVLANAIRVARRDDAVDRLLGAYRAPGSRRRPGRGR